jgi:hypothetical protein
MYARFTAIEKSVVLVTFKWIKTPERQLSAVTLGNAAQAGRKLVSPTSELFQR